MNKNVLILGANSGLGEAIAYEYAAQGHQIILAGRNMPVIENIKSDIEIRFGVRVWVVQLDIDDTGRHLEFFRELPVVPDVSVFTIGYMGDQILAQSSFNEVISITNRNFVNAMSILNIIANDYEERKKGLIIGVSSVAGERGRQSNYFYGAAKAGFSTYLSGLRNRLYKSGVHVLTVKPGFIDTKMVSHLDLPAPLLASPVKMARKVVKAGDKKTSTLYYLGVWRLIMLVIKLLPEAIFKRMKL